MWHTANNNREQPAPTTKSDPPNAAHTPPKWQTPQSTKCEQLHYKIGISSCHHSGSEDAAPHSAPGANPGRIPKTTNAEKNDAKHNNYNLQTSEMRRSRTLKNGTTPMWKERRSRTLKNGNVERKRKNTTHDHSQCGTERTHQPEGL